MRKLQTIFRFKIFNIWLLLFVIVLSFPISRSSNAQTIAPDSCDPLYYASLSSRAWLEAQREITQNQNLIFKPDSVLEYSCFAQNIRQIVTYRDNLFSGGAGETRFSELDDVVDLPARLAEIVMDPMISFLNTNFDHNYLGGRSVYEREEIANSSAYLLSGDAFDCDVMNRVWEEAKCMNFFDNPDHDGFYTFEQYAHSADHRFYPTQCFAEEGTGENFHPPGHTDAQGNLDEGTPITQPLRDSMGQWVDNIVTATEEDFTTDIQETPWIEETMVTHMLELFPAHCTDSHPVATGFHVITTNGIEYNEFVCITPGCHYVPTGENTGDCVP